MTLTGVRETNAMVALNAIRADPPLSRAEVARRTGMSKPTASSSLDLLLAAGLVRTVAAPAESHHRAVYFDAVSDVAYVLGLDIGRRYVRGMLADLDGAVMDRRDIRIPDSSPQIVVDAAVRVHEAIAADLPVELVVTGVPGVPDAEQVLHACPVELEGMPVGSALASALGLPIRVENDINLAALGEHAAGYGRGTANFAFLSVGTGVGSGLILDGRPHRGHRGAAGEVDLAPPGELLAPDSPAADALLEWSSELIQATEGTALSASAGPEAIFAAAHGGDALAVRILSEQARRIAVRMAEISRVVDVELVVLGGGIGLACANLLPEIRQQLAGMLRYPPRIVISALGDAPVLRGAITHGAALAWHQITARRITQAAERKGSAPELTDS